MPDQSSRLLADLERIRSACLDMMAEGRIHFMLDVVRLNGFSECDLPADLPTGLREYCRWKDSEDLNWLFQSTELRSSFFLLRYFRDWSPARADLIHMVEYFSQIELYRIVTAPDASGPVEFGLCLHTPSGSSEGIPSPDRLSAGEKVFLGFMDFAGNVLNCHSIAVAKGGTNAWLTFLLRFLLKNGVLVFDRGLATVYELPKWSLQAIDELYSERGANLMSTRPHSGEQYAEAKKPRGRPTKDGDDSGQERKMYDAWKDGGLAQHFNNSLLELQKAFFPSQSVEDVKRILGKLRKRDCRAGKKP